jgi:four helix bundle protein
LKRSIISVTSNIAEGSTRKSKKDQARFYVITYSSLIEALNQLIIACDLEYINEQKLSVTRLKIEEVSRMINAMYKATNEDEN